MFHRIQHVHLVGIGGIGMSGIAEVLCNLGFNVSGSDMRRSSVTERLEELGVEVNEGHRAENVGDAQVVVRSTAVRDNNPELVEARERSIPVIARAEMLAELMRLKRDTVAVAGSHGKTTTTSMIGMVLGAAGLDPTVVVGGVVGAFGSNARLGKSDLMVVEADESDRSFLMLTPTFTVVTNIDREHMDYYRDMEDMQDCFIRFVNKVPFYGASVLCLDDPYVQAVIPHVKRRRITYGLSAQADVSAHNIKFDIPFGSRFTVWRGQEVMGEVEMRVPGLHNVYNALAAIAISFELEVPFAKTVEGLGAYTGVNRRFQFKGEARGVLVVDDYGHHPTEILATLSAAKDGSGGRRTVVVFQPHRFSRTNELMNEFALAFNNADMLFVSDIYAASEQPIEGVTAEILTDNIRRYGHKNAQYIGEIDGAAEKIIPFLQPNDLVITLGAGSITKLSDEILEKLKNGD